MKSGVVVYSRRHFDPEDARSKAVPSSAGALAEAVYEGAVRVSGSVTYVDAAAVEEWPNLSEVDFLVATESAFCDAVKHFRPKATMLIAVNQSVDVATGKWLKPIRDGHLPFAAIKGSQDGTIGRDPRPTLAADKILMVGDALTMATYLDMGRSPNDVFATPYGAGGQSRFGRRIESRNVLLFPASSIGIRKGSDALRLFCAAVKDQQSAYKVVAIGSPANDYWRWFTMELEREYPDIFEWRGWMDPRHTDFLELLDQTLAIVIPSREEGLVGTAVEAFRSRIPVFTTVDCGMGPVSPSMLLPPNQIEAWPAFVLNRVAQFGECKESNDVFRILGPGQMGSTKPVSDLVERFITSGSVWPEHYVSNENQGLLVSRRARSSEDVPLEEWFVRQYRREKSIISGMSAGGGREMHAPLGLADLGILASTLLLQISSLDSCYIQCGHDLGTLDDCAKGKSIATGGSIHGRNFFTQTSVARINDQARLVGGATDLRGTRSGSSRVRISYVQALVYLRTWSPASRFWRSIRRSLTHLKSPFASRSRE